MKRRDLLLMGTAVAVTLALPAFGGSQVDPWVVDHHATSYFYEQAAHWVLYETETPRGLAQQEGWKDRARGSWPGGDFA